MGLRSTESAVDVRFPNRERHRDAAWHDLRRDRNRRPEEAAHRLGHLGCGGTISVSRSSRRLECRKEGTSVGQSEALCLAAALRRRLGDSGRLCWWDCLAWRSIGITGEGWSSSLWYPYWIGFSQADNEDGQPGATAQRSCLSRIVLRAARSAPAMIVADLGR